MLKRFKQKFSSSVLGRKGFNTLEMMVGLAILAVVILAGASLAQVANKSTQYADRKQELQSLSQMIIERLKNGPSCISALQGQSIAGTNTNGKGNAYGNSGKSLRTAGDTRQFAMYLPGIRAGSAMNIDYIDPTASQADRQILPRRLEIKELGFGDGILLTTVPNEKYLVNIYLQADEIGGMSFKRQLIGSTTITVDAADKITACEAMPADAMKTVCESDTGMGCVWDPNTQPNCRCLRSQILCAAPGYYPVSFESGVPNCRPLGGKTCAAGEYLVGVGIDEVICAPAPTTCPTGTSTAGAGNAVQGLIRCKCANLGETYYSGSGCQPGCPPGTSTSFTGGVSSSPGCNCPTGKVWNGGTAACEVPVTPVAGVCGSSSGQTVASAPTTNLCSSGNATAVAGSGPWTWDCNGINSGATVNCSASVASACKWEYRVETTMGSIPRKSYERVAELFSVAFVPEARACTVMSSCDSLAGDPNVGEPCATDGAIFGSQIRETLCGPTENYWCKIKCGCGAVVTSCPTGSSPTGLGVAVDASCKCDNATDTWDGTTCQTYPRECAAHWAFTTNLNPAICDGTSGDEPASAMGPCTSPYYTDSNIPQKNCSYSGNSFPVVACTRCGPGSNIPGGICKTDLRCGFGGGVNSTCNGSSGPATACTVSGQILGSYAESCDCAGTGSSGGYGYNEIVCRPDGSGGLKTVWECSTTKLGSPACQCN